MYKKEKYLLFQISKQKFYNSLKMKKKSKKNVISNQNNRIEKKKSKNYYTKKIIKIGI